MRSRVMSHFQSALTVRKEMKLSQQVHHIEWIETGGELKRFDFGGQAHQRAHAQREHQASSLQGLVRMAIE